MNLRSGRAARALPAIRTYAEKQGAEVQLTERALHAFDLAARARDAGCDLIVAVGGDGTMNEVASALIGTPAVLGLVPCGSGDGLGRHLGIHGPVAHSLGVLRNGTSRAIDTGLADGHPFFTVAGVGFEAEIAQRFNLLHRRGFLRYLSTSAVALGAWEPQEYAVRHEHGTDRIRAFTVAVANSDQYGNNACIAPGASVQDGLLDLCAVPPLHPLNAVPLLARLFTGTLAGARGTLLRRATHFTIERSSPGLLHTDGEIHQAGTQIEFRVRPASLRIMCPA